VDLDRADRVVRQGEMGEEVPSWPGLPGREDRGGRLAGDEGRQVDGLGELCRQAVVGLLAAGLPAMKAARSMASASCVARPSSACAMWSRSE